jgi:hypothetical protein
MTNDMLSVREKRHITRHKITKKGIWTVKNVAL